MAAWCSEREHARPDLGVIPGSMGTGSYVDQVLADQADLVEPLHTLRQALNYKGT